MNELPTPAAAFANRGQPCGGTACDGGDTLCPDCEHEAEAFERERWAEYHSLIGPIPRC